MLRRILIILLALQGALALAVAAALWRWTPLAAPAALALGLGSVLLLRLGISLHNFYLSWRAGSAVPAAHRLTPLAWLRMALYEFHASMLASSMYMLHSVGMHVAPGGRGMPVLLLHGYVCNSGYWAQLSAALRRAGVSHAALDLEPLGAGIDEYLPSVHAALERLRAATGASRVIIVAHSMGGLVARAYLRRYGDAAVARVITLGTPHQGTLLASFGPGRNARQMRHGSPWLADLAASEANLQRSMFTSIFSVHDNIVAPQDSSRLSGAHLVECGAIGHVALGRHPLILRSVLDEIAASTIDARAVDSAHSLE